MPFIQVPPDSTGKTVETVTPGTEHRQVIAVGGAGAVAEIADVANVGPVAADYGVIARTIEKRFAAVLTTTALGISGVFTQAGQDGVDDGVVYILAVARADVASAASGFIIEEYDGTDDDFVDANFIRTVASKTVSANTTTYLYGAIRSRKWRVKYTNGGTAQVTFKLTAAASNVSLFAVSADGTQLIGIVDSADARISPALTGQFPAALVGGRLDVNVGAALPTGANNIGDVDVLTLPALVAGAANIGDVDIASPLGAGTEAAAVRVTIATDSTGLVSVDDNAGSITVDAPVATPVATRLSDGVAFIDPRDVSDRAARLVGQVEGRAASGVAVAGNPNLIGARANLNEPAVVADGQAVSAWADLLGRLVVLEGHANPELPVTVNGSAAGVVVIAAPAAGTRLVIRKGSVHNRGVEQVISLRDGAAGTIRWTLNAAADGGGSLFNFGSRGWQLTAATALVADIGAASADVNVTEYSIEAV